eukprot:TRINITY_DN17123_c0_g1_i1.p1 TRINITY_DN17123_c0_g1~~TRINITY_DN17123_c0_g1_i1.p1  ORF type:complete len:452 (+),score=139.48 TRINITY_DN17123_c0_g1_i1:207-1562(+)
MVAKIGRWRKHAVKAPSDVIPSAAGAPPLRGRAHHAAVALDVDAGPGSKMVVVGGREQQTAGATAVAAPGYLVDISELGAKNYQPVLLDPPAGIGSENEIGEVSGGVTSGGAIYVAGGRTPEGVPRRGLARCDIKGSKAEWRNVCDSSQKGGVFGREEQLRLTGHAICRVRAQGADWIYTFGGEATDSSGHVTTTDQVFRRRVGDHSDPFELFRTGNMVPAPRRDAAMVHLPIGTASGSGYLLLWGGRGTDTARHPDSDVHILNIDERSWYTVEVAEDPSMADAESGTGGRPTLSFGHTLQLVGHSVLLIGGADSAESHGAHLVLNPLTTLWMLRFDEHGALRWLREGEHFRMQKDDEAQIALEGGRHFHTTCAARARPAPGEPEQDCIVLIGGINQSADVTGQGHYMILWLNDGQCPAGPLPDPDLKRVKQSVFCAGMGANSGMCQCVVC